MFSPVTSRRKSRRPRTVCRRSSPPARAAATARQFYPQRPCPSAGGNVPGLSRSASAWTRPPPRRRRPRAASSSPRRRLQHLVHRLVHKNVLSSYLHWRILFSPAAECRPVDEDVQSAEITEEVDDFIERDAVHVNLGQFRRQPVPRVHLARQQPRRLRCFSSFAAASLARSSGAAAARVVKAERMRANGARAVSPRTSPFQRVSCVFSPETVASLCGRLHGLKTGVYGRRV